MAEQINLMFWNLKNKDLSENIIDLITENDVNLFVFAECNFDIMGILKRLNNDYKEISLMGACKGIRIISDLKYSIELFHDNARYTIISLRDDSIYFSFLLVAVHLPSKMYKNSADFNEINRLLTSDIREAEKMSGISNIIVIGDFNQNPFDESMIAINGMHALLHKATAAGGNREFHGNLYKKFYNPMLNLFKDNESSFGTYFYNSGNVAVYYWNFFDQVIISPELIDYFILDKLKIINATQKNSFLKNGKPDAEHYSDHLPIKFTIKTGEI